MNMSLEYGSADDKGAGVDVFRSNEGRVVRVPRALGVFRVIRNEQPVLVEEARKKGIY